MLVLDSLGASPCLADWRLSADELKLEGDPQL